MNNPFIHAITSESRAIRNTSIDKLVNGYTGKELLELASELESFRKSTDNLYHRVRAALFLYYIYRFSLLSLPDLLNQGKPPARGIKAAHERDFELSIDIYINEIQNKNNFSPGIFSAIAESYHKLSFKCLLDQVKLSISQCRENYHLFNIKSLDDYPYNVPSELTKPDLATGNYPVGIDCCPIRLDPSHSGWSDIFFLGMDFPEGARVVNISVDIKPNGDDGPTLPPCECYCRYIEEPVIKLSSVDLNVSKSITTLSELFNFSNDHLSLLKAGVVASGIIPSCFEFTEIPLQDILSRLLGKDGGIEIVTRVNNIPKGSRLAVSTTLLASIISRLMRFSGQIKELTGPISESDRRIVASRAILGEWLGGSGGGWQDSGGLWPGIKVIAGRLADDSDPEFGISRGCLLPEHTIFTKDDISSEIEEKILRSIVLVHGGISQDVGSILEMVTEKYMLKLEDEWDARLKGMELFDRITEALRSGDMKELGRLTTEDWNRSIQPIIPGVNNAFTDELIAKLQHEFADDYWGFLMLGGMSGGGMAFIVDPEVNVKFKKRTGEIMYELKDKYISSYPFIIDPIVYDFSFNHIGISSDLFKGEAAVIPYITDQQQNKKENGQSAIHINEEEIERNYGFDHSSHEEIRSQLLKGEISLKNNRLPADTEIKDIDPKDILHYETLSRDADIQKIGSDAIKNGEVAVVTFAAGMGSRWSHGAAVAKPVSPFLKAGGRYRTFIETHLAKSRSTSEKYGRRIPHVFTTSYLTHDSIESYLAGSDHFGYGDDIYISPGKSIAKRVYPMIRDLQFIWDSQLQQGPDDDRLKIKDARNRALIEWVSSKGEGLDYSENKPMLRFNPPGHWFEIPNMLKNGTMAALLSRNPGLKYILASNIDTLGVNVSPELLGGHISGKSSITFEVTPRYIEDKGGGLARVNGKLQLIEGLALPHDDDEFKLSYYNTLTNWITIDLLLESFGLSRETVLRSADDKGSMEKVIEAVIEAGRMLPTYVTIKNVKYVWGNGQEDTFPVAQFEKLWGDISSLDNINVSFVSVPRQRGQQLKEPSQLDRWINDGSFEYLMNIASF